MSQPVSAELLERVENEARRFIQEQHDLLVSEWHHYQQVRFEAGILRWTAEATRKLEDFIHSVRSDLTRQNEQICVDLILNGRDKQQRVDSEALFVSNVLGIFK